jgi:hypothetical protein
MRSHAKSLAYAEGWDSSEVLATQVHLITLLAFSVTKQLLKVLHY